MRRITASLNLRASEFTLGHIALVFGSISTLASLAEVFSIVNLRFHFAYVESQIRLDLIQDPALGILWAVSTIIFAVYPIATQARKITLIRYCHATLPISAALALWNRDLFPLLALNILAAYAATLCNSQRTLGIATRKSISLAAGVLFTIMIPLEILAAVAIVTDPESVLVIYPSGSGALQFAGRLSLNLFYLADLLVPAMLLLLMVSPLLISLLRANLPAPATKSSFGNAKKAMGLVTVSVLAALAALLPYVYHDSPIGVDAAWYQQTVDSPLSNPMELATKEPRAAYLLLLYAIKIAFRTSTSHALVVGVVILSILTALGTYYFMIQAFHRMDFALLSGLMSSVAPQVLVGSFAAVFDSWLAFAETLFFFGLTLKLRQEAKLRFPVVTALTLTLVMLTHVWTWVVVMLVTAIYGSIIVCKRGADASRGKSRNIFMILGSSLLISFLLFIAHPFEAFQRAIEFGISWVVLANLATPTLFLHDISSTMTNYVGGFYSNWILLFLAIVGVFGLVRAKDDVRHLVQVWIVVPSILMLFLGSDIQWRLLFLFPYSILAMVGIDSLMTFLRKPFPIESASYSNLVLGYLVQFSFLASIMLILWNNVMRSMIFVAAAS